MVERKVIVDKVSTFVSGKLNEILDNKIIESAITFYFKDEDSGSTKTWNYFKTAN